jgi:hypothetical protein
MLYIMMANKAEIRSVIYDKGEAKNGEYRMNLHMKGKSET